MHRLLAEAAPSTGDVVRLVLLGVTVFLVFKSKKPLRTTLYTIIAMALTVGLPLGIAHIFPVLNTEVVGKIAFDGMVYVGFATALTDSSRSGT